MAEGKKTILIYVEWREIFNSLSDDEAGRLIKHLFNYVNDLNPIAPDRITELSFIQIKQQLKRDLEKWENIKVGRSNAGKASGVARKQKGTKRTSVNFIEQNSTKRTVKVKDKVKVNINEVILYFKENGYKKEIAEKAFKYYEEANWHDGNGKKVLNWKQKMQAVWFKDENKIIDPPKQKVIFY